MDQNTAETFLTDYLAQTKYPDLNDISRDRLSRILGVMRGLNDVEVN